MTLGGLCPRDEEAAIATIIDLCGSHIPQRTLDFVASDLAAGEIDGALDSLLVGLVDSGHVVPQEVVDFYVKDLASEPVVRIRELWPSLIDQLKNR